MNTYREYLTFHTKKKIEFINIPPISEYKLNKVPKLIGSLFKRVPWQYIPVLLQTNFWVVVHGRKIYY